MKVKQTKDNESSAHEARVAEVFNNISTSDSHIPCKEKYDNDNSMSTVDREPDVSTVNNTIDECAIDDTITDVDELLVDPDPGNKDADATAALRLLSNLKKYKINKMCTQNLIEVGWELLGENFSEEIGCAH